MRFEIESFEQLEQHIAEHGGLQRVAVQGVDLSAHEELLRSCATDGAVFLGCRLSAESVARVLSSGGLVFPSLRELPYRPYRSTLYTPDELLLGYDASRPRSFWEDTVDAKIYIHYDGTRRAAEPTPIVEALAQRIHDHAIDDALHDLLHTGAKRVVAIMGGHALRRDEPAYLAVARIAHGLANAGYFCVSGGGPGAMEATNLGAYLKRVDADALCEAVAQLADAPTYRDRGWVETALEVRRHHPGGADSLGIPTWFYGHEPPNLFATHIAKYFSNSIREDGLLAIARHGVIYAPGSAGTIQEVFMDAAQNHYGTFRDVSPMVFVGTEYWTKKKPVYPLLVQLAEGRQYGPLLGITDEPEEVLRFIEEHPPQPYEK